MTKDTPSCCTNQPGKNCVFVIRMMARDVAFLGCTSGSALRTSVVNIVPSKAWERGMRCKAATLKPFVGTLRVESPSGSA